METGKTVRLTGKVCVGWIGRGGLAVPEFDGHRQPDSGREDGLLHRTVCLTMPLFTHFTRPGVTAFRGGEKHFEALGEWFTGICLGITRWNFNGV